MIKTYCLYHGPKWDKLTLAGWQTVWVYARKIALMVSE